MKRGLFAREAASQAQACYGCVLGADSINKALAYRPFLCPVATILLACMNMIPVSVYYVIVNHGSAREHDSG